MYIYRTKRDETRRDGTGRGMRQEEESSRTVSASGSPVADASLREAIAKWKETPTEEKSDFLTRATSFAESVSSSLFHGLFRRAAKFNRAVYIYY